MRNNCSLCALALAAALLLASLCQGASTSFGGADSMEEFETGSGDGVSITYDGRVVLAPRFEPIEIEGAQYAWAAAPDGDGGLYVVSGTPGVLHRVTGRRTERLFELATEDITALAVGPDGEAYVGTAPGGEVYRVSPDGAVVLFYETGAGYVWSMLYSSEHGLIVGTGDPALVQAVTGEGEGVVVYESTESSVTALLETDGRVLAGTSGGGLLVDATPGEDIRVLYDTDHDEIVGIADLGDGRVAFVASSIAFEQAFDESETYGQGLGEGSVYVTTPAGGAVEVWRSLELPLASVGLGPGGVLWVGTGADGLVHELEPDGSRSLVRDLDCQEILSISDWREGTLLTAGMPARVYRVMDGLEERGSYESDVLDAGGAAVWGEASWRYDGPASGIRMETRSGNSSSPDATWSDWSVVAGDGEGRIESPAARFLQWRFELSSDRVSLRSAGVSFLRENLAPKVSWVVVHEPAGLGSDDGGGGAVAPVRQTLPGGIEVTYALEPGREQRLLPAVVRGLRTATWDAYDPDGDPLTYDIEIRRDEDGAWQTLAEGIEWRTAHTWDTQSMVDGEYVLRVVASDAGGNRPGSALSASRTGEPFVVDNSPPEIVGFRVERDGDRLVVEGETRDELSPLAAVDVAVNYTDWNSAFAGDGVFDSRGETYRAVLDVPADGAFSVTVRVLDAAGNMAVERKELR